VNSDHPELAPYIGQDWADEQHAACPSYEQLRHQRCFEGLPFIFLMQLTFLLFGSIGCHFLIHQRHSGFPELQLRMFNRMKTGE
jgi:hypothetical protein